MIVGVWIMIFLFLGFPLNFKKTLAVITGLAVVVGAYRMKPDESNSSVKNSSKPFVEHKSEPKSEPISPAEPEIVTEQAPTEVPSATSLNTSSTDQPLTQ